MKKIKKISTVFAAVTLSATLALSVCSCSTTAFSNLNSYFANVSEILGGNDKGGTGKTEKVEKTKLDAPTAFSVSASGEYSFKGSENATAYNMSFYDVGNLDGDAVYSATIDVSEVNTYSGKISDLIDYSYGGYTVKLVAYASRVSNYTDSDAVEASFTVTGDLSAPQTEYKWDGTTLTLQLSNPSVYASQVVPDSVVYTVTDTTDGTEETVTLSSVNTSSAMNNNIEVNLTQGHSYTVSAVAKSSSKYVTSSSSKTTVTEIGELTADEKKSDGFEERGGGPGGGPGGGGMSLTISAIEPFEEGTDKISVSVNAMGSVIACKGTLSDTPSDGSKYTYSLFGKDTWGASVTGKLEIKDDNTVACTIDGFGPFSSINKNGTWEIVDGNITISLG